MIIAAPLLAATVSAGAADLLDLDFAEGVDAWQIVVDGVMGGRSSGDVGLSEAGNLLFTGVLSLENNGGFSQMRNNVRGDRFIGAEGIEIRVRGDGRTYQFDIRASNARLMAGGFQQNFETKPGEWTTIALPFDGFRLYSFGQPVANPPALAPEMIESIGVTLADKNPGGFALEVDSIRAYGGSTSTTGAPAAKTDGKTISAAKSAKALRLCEQSISRAVPLFNSGQPAACAAIYEITIEAMLALGGHDLGQDVVRRLELGLAQANVESEHDWSNRAWIYRRALDEIYPRLARQAGPMATAASSH